MSGYVDLHLHVIPNVDDGVRSVDDARALLAGLGTLGFTAAVTTPHIRPGLYPNQRAPLVSALEALRRDLGVDHDLPTLELGAEHWVDESLLGRVTAGEAIAYPGEKAILVEIPPTAFPLGFADLCFRLLAKGKRPVLAHPERYAPLFERSDPLRPHLERGVATLLDLMSLAGRYGRSPQRAAERMLDEGLYDAACSDTHAPTDLPYVERAIVTLERRVGARERDRLLRDGPTRILAGTLGR